MMARPDHLIALARAQVAPAGAALLTLLIAAGAGWPQGASPPPSLGVQEPTQQAPPQQSQPAPSPSPPREENPGLLNDMGRWFDDLNTRAKDAARDTSDSLSRLAKPSSMVSGRMICPVSVNGGPDCKLGADKLCQSKGFKDGKSLNSDSAETCSAKVLIPGRRRKPDDCRTDHYVTQALCQ
jgi:hypothetical protein